jgi:hypothetical protein
VISGQSFTLSYSVRGRRFSQSLVVDRTKQILSASKPRLLFEGQFLLSSATTPNYDMSRDGQRFLMVKADAVSEGVTQSNVVFNWFEDLKRLGPPESK